MKRAFPRSAPHERATGQTTTYRQAQAQALAGEWYKWYVAQHEDNPGKAATWAHLEEVLTDEIWWLAPDWYKEDPRRDPKCEWAREPGALTEIRPMVADEAKTAQSILSG